MEKIRDLLVQLPGLASESGNLRGLAGPVQLVLVLPGLPEFLDVRKGFLLWSVHRTRPGYTPPADLLVRFANLDNEYQAERFAEQYGPMGICRHGYMRTPTAPWVVRFVLEEKKRKPPRDGWWWTCCSLPFMFRTRDGWVLGESLKAWLSHARWLRELVGQWAVWRIKGTPPEASRILGGPLPERTPMAVSARVPSRVHLPLGVEDLLRADGAQQLVLAAWRWASPSLHLLDESQLEQGRLRVVPHLVRVTGEDLAQFDLSVQMQVGLAGLATWLGKHNMTGLSVGFWPVVAVQLLSLLSDQEPARWARCCHCSALYEPRRLPRRGEQNFCPKCRQDRVPDRYRARKYRVRKRRSP